LEVLFLADQVNNRGAAHGISPAPRFGAADCDVLRGIWASASSTMKPSDGTP